MQVRIHSLEMTPTATSPDVCHRAEVWNATSTQGGTDPVERSRLDENQALGRIDGKIPRLRFGALPLSLLG